MRSPKSLRGWEFEVLRRAEKFTNTYVQTIGFGRPIVRAAESLNEAVEHMVAMRKAQRISAPPPERAP